MQSRYYDANICRFINSDFSTISRLCKNEINSSNLFSYCGNNPLNKIDPSGYVIETTVDVASVGWSLYNFIKAPSWINFGYLAWDVASAFVPFVPGLYTAKGGKLAVKIAINVGDLKSTKYLQLGKYKDIKKLFKGVKGVEVHRIITNKWRKAIPYVTNYSKISYSKMEKAINNVYKDMPELKKQALKWFKQNWKK